jgi:hypothetical protein
MAERLNNLAYAQSGGHYSNADFNPRSVSLDIRTPEELAAVNDFLLTLGRDVSGISPRQPVVPAQSNFSSPESYFDPSNLSQLGLTGMPGIPPSPPSFSDHTYGNGAPQPQYSTNNYQSSRSSHSSVPQQQHQPQYSSNIYAPITDASMLYDYGQQTRRASNKYQPTSSFTHQQQQHYSHPTPPLESGGSPPSSVSTPVNVTPPQVPMQMPEFDYIRPTRGAAPVAHLAQPDYMAKPHLRPMIPLKSAPPRERPLPVESHPPLHEHHARPLAAVSAAANASASGSGSSGSATRPGGTLYPLLVAEGDREFKLPPLGRMYRSPSPAPSRESTPSSAASSPTPPHARVLPGIKYVAGGVGSSGVPPRSPIESEELAHRVGRIGLERERGGPREVVTQEQRKRHAELILGLLVDINNNFKRKYASSGSRDVEMTAV